ncbi:MAG: COP23 domain-containing protein [Prochloraceae cyanobacterium]
MQPNKPNKINLALKAISLPIAVFLATSNAHANANSIPLSRSNDTLAQNRSQTEQPPDIIIDTNDRPFPGDRNTNRDREIIRDTNRPFPEDRNTNRDREINRDTNRPFPEDRNTNRDRNRDRTTADANFTCDYVRGEYTVMYRPRSQQDRAYAWAVPGRMGGGWSPQRRCNEIANRLEFYRPDGLNELRTSVENGYEILCATTQRDSSCRIVLTVPPGQDAEIVRDRVFENLTLAESGQETQGVYTFTDSGQANEIFSTLEQLLGGRRSSSRSTNITRSGDINLRPFLDRFDGGTGERLYR